jgi:hypothetical protein
MPSPGHQFKKNGSAVTAGPVRCGPTGFCRCFFPFLFYPRLRFPHGTQRNFIMAKHSLPHRLALAAACAAAFTCAGAYAAGGDAAAAQAQYKRDLADCDSSHATEARATCRTEAMRAYQQAKAGDFHADAQTFTQNERLRCEPLKGIDRTACEERVNGQGTMSGSVGGGGDIRSSTVTVPAR